MFQFTVHPVHELQLVKNTASLIKQTNSGKDLTYDEYIQLLSHAASNYNNGQVRMKGKIQLYLHEINGDILDMYDETHSDHEPFYIDTPVDSI
jgi:hypothetical protein